ncbi:MAG: 1-phosphofructokinase family hexose kinase [Phycisphaerae bacterium]
MILCIGTTPAVQRTMVFDRLAVDDVNRAAAVREYASGKAVNVARVLGVLGETARLVGFAGGRRGQFLLEELAREGIAAEMIPVAGQTRLCTTIIDRATGVVTELVEEAPPASADEWAALDGAIDRLAPTAGALVFSGTLAPGAPPDWIARRVGADRLTIVDAKGEALRRALAAGGRTVGKLNRFEFEQTLGRALASEDELLAAMRDAAPPAGGLIVTTGRTGAIALIGERAWRVTPPDVDAVSPIGSGDAFAAGLAAGWARGPGEALRLACACGAANAQTADAGHVSAADVERLSPLVRVCEI